MMRTALALLFAAAIATSPALAATGTSGGHGGAHGGSAGAAHGGHGGFSAHGSGAHAISARSAGHGHHGHHGHAGTGHHHHGMVVASHSLRTGDAVLQLCSPTARQYIQHRAYCAAPTKVAVDGKIG